MDALPPHPVLRPRGDSDVTTPDVASFYHLPSGLPPGRPCEGTACWIARQSGIPGGPPPSPPSPRIHCLGHCFEAPSFVGSSRQPAITTDGTPPIVLARILRGGARTLEEYRRLGGYQALERCRGWAPGQVLAEMDRSELRGRGGAGFPLGRKWRAACAAPGPEKHVVANADEGDAGAYVDRVLLEQDPHGILEGMLIAATVVRASRGWIYLRSEYPSARESLQRALTEARAAGLLGPDALGPGRPFDISVHLGGGSYVCGEETALLRSLEGRRPTVSPRPPYATEQGAWGRPTLVHNVETLANVPWIVLHGGDAYRTRGFSRSRGTKVLSLNALFRRPGLYEVELGVTLRHVVEDLAGGLREGSELKGLLVGGPLAGIVPPALLDTRLGFEELRAVGAGLGHGGVLAFDQRTSILALLHHVFSFAAYESCGACTPCRGGSRTVERLLEPVVAAGRLPREAAERCQRIIEALGWTSLCGLGTGLAEFAGSAFRHYGEELSK